EYNVRAINSSNKSYSIGTFKHVLPGFLKKKDSAAKWFLHKEGLKGYEITDVMRDKYKNKPWIIQDEAGQQQYQGKLEGSQQGTYYVLVIQGKEFLAIPVDAWYYFSKVAKYKQLSLEEAEEKMKNQRRTAEGFSRWMMKIANNGAAKDWEVQKIEGGGGGGKQKRVDDETDDTVLSDKEEEDVDEDEERKSRLGLNKIGGDDDEEEVRRGDLDADGDDIEKGDDWEHEEVFTDDDEVVGSDAEDEDESDSEDLAPPEINQDEDEGNEEGGEGLSTSGKELMKLLERQAWLDDDNGDKYVNEENHLLPVLAHKQKKILIEEPLEATATKAKSPVVTPTGAVTTKSAKGKRKSCNEDGQNKRQKTEDSKSTKPAILRDEGTPTSKSVSTSGKQALPCTNKATYAQATGAVTEEELLNFIRQMAPITTHHLAAEYKHRIKRQEDMSAFAGMLKKISRLEKRE
ncbi:hypothetical protein KI387_035471, partial [Taxus chinensis]